MENERVLKHGTLRERYIDNGDGTYSPQVHVRGEQYPDSPILFRDVFNDSFCAWENLYQFSSADQNVWFKGTGSSPHYMPITLSPRGAFGAYALKLQTANTKTPYYGSSAFAIKRYTHQVQKVKNKGRVKLHFWFSFGSDSNAITGYSNAAAPRYLVFAIDTMFPTSSPTQNSTGKRSFFQVRWRQSTYNSGTTIYSYDGSVEVTAGTGKAYNASGYITPEFNFIDTGYKMDFPFNQNKLNIQRFSMTVDCETGQYIELEANSVVYDMTKCPAIAGGSPPSLLQPDDPTYNVFEFNGGLNALVGVTNLAEGNPTASKLEIHQDIMEYV